MSESLVEKVISHFLAFFLQLGDSSSLVICIFISLSSLSPQIDIIFLMDLRFVASLDKAIQFKTEPSFQELAHGTWDTLQASRIQLFLFNAIHFQTASSYFFHQMTYVAGGRCRRQPNNLELLSVKFVA